MPSPSPLLATPSPKPTPAGSPFRVIDAMSCAPALVPGASRAPSNTAIPNDKLVLGVPILEYHRIVTRDLAGNSLPGLVMPPDLFDAQMGALAAAGFGTITLVHLADDLAAGVRPPPRTFVITIDDGWSDGYTYALPILQKYGFVATYFVIAKRIGWGSSFLDPAQLRALVAAGDEIGDHTMDHVDLSAGSQEHLAYEIDGAAATIASVIGQWPQTLAYPFGGYGTDAIDAIRACGNFRMAVIEGGSTYETWTTRFTTPRIEIDSRVDPQTLLGWVQHPRLPASPRPSPSASPRT